MEQVTAGAASGAASGAGAASTLLERKATTATAMNERRAIVTDVGFSIEGLAGLVSFDKVESSGW